MLKKILTLTLLAGTSVAHGQARATATRLADGQIGASILNANSDYSRSRFNGIGAYVDLDFHRGIGAEFEFNFITDQDPNTNVYESTFEVGPRYSRHYGRLQPFVKAMIGNGILNLPYNSGSAKSLFFAGGVGTDVRILSRMNARVQYEYQEWYNFQPSPLTPALLSVGLAYHFK